MAMDYIMTEEQETAWNLYQYLLEAINAEGVEHVIIKNVDGEMTAEVIVNENVFFN